MTRIPPDWHGRVTSLVMRHLQWRSMSRNRSRRKSRRTGGAKGGVLRFFRALLVSAAGSFSVASCVMHPQLLEQAQLVPFLEQLGVRQTAHEPALAHDGAYVQTRF